MDQIEELNVDIPQLKRGNIKIAILYPNEYYLGMSNLGLQGLYYQFIQSNEFHVNRFFYSSTSLHQVYSPENHFSLNQANIILVSQSFEVDFIHLVEILHEHNIEALTENRDWPFIGAGGAFPSLNPDFFLSVADIVFKGEFESYIEELKNFCVYLARCQANKDYLLAEADKLFGDFIVHSLSKQHNEVVTFPALTQPNYSHILTPHTSFANTFLLEITRGCRFNCHYCVVRGLYGKLRCFAKEDLLSMIDLGLSRTKKIGLISTLTTEHPDLKELVRYISDQGGEVGFSSLRLDQIDDELLDLIKTSNQSILTIAPEVASEKLQKKIRKQIKLEKIYDLFDRGLRLKFRKFKLYFMIGFVEEDEDDLKQMIALIKNLRAIALKHAKQLKFMPEIILSVNQFVPKPCSKLKSEPFLEQKVIEKKLKYLKKNLLPLGNISIKTDSYIDAYLQWRFGLADKKEAVKIIDFLQEGRSKKALWHHIKRRPNNKSGDLNIS